MSRRTVKRRDGCMLPKATKSEDSVVSKVVNKVGKYLPFCSPIPFSVFHLRAEIFFHRMNHKIQHIKGH